MHICTRVNKVVVCSLIGEFRPLVGLKHLFHKRDNSLPVSLHLEIKKHLFMVYDTGL